MLRRLDRVRTQTLAIVALIAVFVAATVVSPYIPGTTLHAQQVGPGGVPGAGGGGAVSSVFGRTGAVVAASGDYTAAQVTNAADVTAANTFIPNQTIHGASTTQGWQVCSTGTNCTTYGVGSSGQLTVTSSNAGTMTWTSAGLTIQAGGRYLWSGYSSGLASSANGIVNCGNGSINTDTSCTFRAKLYQAGMGTQITAAATIAPTFQIHHITGATSVTTITPPANFSSGQITLIPDDVSGQTTGTGGNIALASVMIQNKALIMTWDGTKWYPSY